MSRPLRRVAVISYHSSPLLEPGSGVVGRSDAVVRAGLLATQVLGLALTRYVLRLPPVAAMDRDTIVAWLGPTLQRYLAGAWPRLPEQPLPIV